MTRDSSRYQQFQSPTHNSVRRQLESKPVEYGRIPGGMPPMDHQPRKPAPDHQTAWTLYRSCRARGLPLDDRQRSAVGSQRARLAAEQNLPAKKVRERVAPGQWSKSRLYPEPFLNDWLARYRHAKAQTTPTPARSPRPKPAANA